MTLEAIDHVDLVVSSFERSLPFYEGLLRFLGYVDVGDIVGERGERVVYLSRHQTDGAVGLRERRLQPARTNTTATPSASTTSPSPWPFVHDPDGMKLEFVHRPEEGDLVLRVAALEARLARLS
jgi:catechol 2,3-dioxygenase-like lactoylglutathione lyase family enzyme